MNSKALMDMTSKEMIKEARRILQNYPEDKKIRDPIDGRRMLTRQEILKRFDGDNEFAALFTARIVFGGKADRFFRHPEEK